MVTVTSSTPGTVTNVTSSLASGGITAPAASAPFAVATAPVDVAVDALLALLLTAIAVVIGPRSTRAEAFGKCVAPLMGA